MAKPDDLSADHMSWLVKCRSENQAASLKLYLVIKDNEEHLRENWSLGNIGQALVAACFSLWRAVFLSDIGDDDASSTIVNAQKFLGSLVLHNMVAYPQDRSTRDWTFLYYVNNARYRLEAMSKEFPEILPASFVATDGIPNPKDSWSFHHNACEVALRNFEKALRKKPTKKQ
ncbi:hypothetical protein [Bradyrhizobium embrapense]